MSQIAQCMPEFSMRDVHRIAVQAEPELAYQRVRAVDLDEVQMVRRLRRWQTLPGRVRAWWQGRRKFGPATARIDDIVRSVEGVRLLADGLGHELVLGAVGKFWLPGRQLQLVTPSAFRSFAEPGFGKLALSLRVTPRSFGGSWITVELRASATDPAAESHMRRAWCVIGRLAAALSTKVLERLAQDLGPCVEDESLRLPGDALLQDVPFQTTHAMTIEARPEEVWSRLLSLGASRFLLGRLGKPALAGDTRAQTPALGQRLPGLSGALGDGAVLRVEPRRLLILGDGLLLPSDEHKAGLAPSARSTTWAFVLSPIGDDATRLVVRVRSRTEHSLGMTFLEPLTAAVRDTLDRRQLDALCRHAQSFDRACAA